MGVGDERVGGVDHRRLGRPAHQLRRDGWRSTGRAGRRPPRGRRADACPERPARPACCQNDAIVPGKPLSTQASSPPMSMPSSSALVATTPSSRPLNSSSSISRRSAGEVAAAVGLDAPSVGRRRAGGAGRRRPRPRSTGGCGRRRWSCVPIRPARPPGRRSRGCPRPVPRSARRVAAGSTPRPAAHPGASRRPPPPPPGGRTAPTPAPPARRWWPSNKRTWDRRRSAAPAAGGGAARGRRGCRRSPGTRAARPPRRSATGPGMSPTDRGGEGCRCAASRGW